MNPFGGFGLAAARLAAACFLCGCQSSSAETLAVLEEAGPETMDEIKTVIARAMNRASVEIGPGDLTKTSTVSALPPRLTPNEDRSLAAPTEFDLVIRDGACFLVRRDTSEEFALKGVTCKPADAN